MSTNNNDSLFVLNQRSVGTWERMSKQQNIMLMIIDMLPMSFSLHDLTLKNISCSCCFYFRHTNKLSETRNLKQFVEHTQICVLMYTFVLIQARHILAPRVHRLPLTFRYLMLVKNVCKHGRSVCPRVRCPEAWPASSQINNQKRAAHWS